MKEFLLSFLFILHSLSAIAQERNSLEAREQLIGTQALERELISDLDLRLKLNSLIIEVANQIDREHPGLNPWQDGGKLAEIFRDKSKVFADFYLERMSSLAPEKKNLFQKSWQSIKWENIVDLFKRTTLGVQTLFKRKGFGIAIAVLLGFLSDYTIPIILSNIGAPWLIPISAVMPYQLLYSMLPQKVIELQIRFKVQRSLGGQKAYRAYMHQERATREALKKMRDDTILIPIVDSGSSQVEALSVRQTNWFKSYLNRIGFNDSQFSLSTLKRFIDKNNIRDDYIARTMQHPRLKRWQKAALIATHLQESMDEELKIAFRERFDKSFTQLKSFAPWDGFEAWTKELLKAKSIERINELFHEVPRGTPTRLVLEVWQDIILPHYASQTSLNYFAYRKLVEDFASTRAVIITNGNEAWGLAAHQALIRYVGQSLDDKAFKKCQNNGQQVLRFLIAN